MRKGLFGALMISTAACGAQAADLESVVSGLKDPLPDKISAYGVTFFGVIDIGYAYQTKGLPASANDASTIGYEVFGNKQWYKPISTVTANAMQQSQVGIKVEENVWRDVKAIAQFDTGV
jgi:opacity protein-like surface antigen